MTMSVRTVPMILVSAVFAIGMFSCGNAGAASAGQSGSDTIVYTLPEIPQTLTTPGERATYLVGHYWDRFNPALLRTADDSVAVVQAFVDFLTIIPEVEKGEADKAVYRLLDKTSADRAAYAFILELATKYLYEADSPMMDEEMLLPYLQYAADSARVDDYIRMRANFLLERVLKNVPEQKRQTSNTSHGTTKKEIYGLFRQRNCF